MINFSYLRAFYHVAKTGSYTKASEVLGISQPAVSQSIKNLQEALKTQLFHRVGNKTVLTAKGEECLEMAVDILSNLENLERTLKADPENLVGDLKVVASYGLASFFILPHIPLFLKKYPGIRLCLELKDTIPDLEISEADIVLRPYVNGQEDLIQTFLLKNKVQLYASPEYLEKFGIPEKPEDLDHHRLICFGGTQQHSFEGMNWPLTLGTKPGVIRIPFIELNHPQGRCELAEAGVGITTISKEHPGLGQMNLIQVLPHIEGPEIDSYFVYSQRLRGAPLVECFKKYLKDTLSEG